MAGVCTAYELGRKGYSVTVVDCSATPGEQCSAVPAGGMQKSNPTVNRDSWLSVIKSWNPFTSMPEDKFFHINLLKTITDPHFIRWAMLFTYNSIKNQNDFEQDRQKQQFKFTLFSQDLFGVAKFTLQDLEV